VNTSLIDVLSGLSWCHSLCGQWPVNQLNSPFRSEETPDQRHCLFCAKSNT